MILYLVRHGNTFAPGDQVTWVGASQDLQLVQSGREQARALGLYLADAAELPDAIYTGPLQRAQETARLLSDATSGVSLQVDERLNEVDYGAWSGRTNEEIESEFGSAELDAWNSRGEWPASGVFSGSEEEVRSRVMDFLKDIADRHKPQDSIVAVSSNGVLRYFLCACSGAFEKAQDLGTFKVRTGAVCRLRLIDAQWSVEQWNFRPD